MKKIFLKNLFTKNILSKLNLGNAVGGALTGLIPSIMGKLGGILKDKDGDGDVDINDIILTLKGGGAPAASSAAGSIIGNAAKSILGGILKKK